VHLFGYLKKKSITMHGNLNVTVQGYKFLILDAHHPATVYLREPVNEDPWLFGEAKRGPRV
jgi:hypothetical protein